MPPRSSTEHYSSARQQKARTGLTCPGFAYALVVMKMKKQFPLLAALLAAALLLLHPEAAAEAVRSGLTLCFRTVVPSLFPFFAVTALLLDLGLADCLQGFFSPLMGPVFRMRGAGALPLLTGLLGGYPTGAKTAASLFQQGQLSRQEAELLLGFCDNCGPAFLLGYVGAGVLGSPRLGLWLFCIHTLSALLTGMLLSRLVPDRGPRLLRSNLPVKASSFPQALTAAVSGALSSTLNICAFVVLFQVLAALLASWAAGPVLGALEMVSGVAALKPGPAGFITAAAIVGWGGLSVHCQALSATAPAGLSFHWHWVGKALQAALSAALAAAAVYLLL